MVATSVKTVRTTPEGRTEVQAFIVADTTPSPLPTTGEGITGMSADMIFAPFSIIYVIENVTPKMYIANEAGKFIAQL